MKSKVLCAITNIYIKEGHFCISYNPNNNLKKVIIPLINHLHDDLESGQIIPHYHADTRYYGKQDLVKYEVGYPYIRIPENQYELDWFMLEKHSDNYQGITNKSVIESCKLNGNKIIDNKCVHKGFDLSNIKDNNGVITCPLHGLQYSIKTKKLVKQ